MSEVDQVTNILSVLDIGTQPTTRYEHAFNEIVEFVEKNRASAVSHDELTVTNKLAGPFTYGGILVLLQEPRDNHPWPKGIDAVVSDCNTLHALNEGLQIGSNKVLSLNDNVSLLDSRPFFTETEFDDLKKKQDELYDLVIAAIEAKQPDVILCMGKVANDVLGRASPQLQESVHIVGAVHPSYSINRNPTNTEMREKLLRDICEACHRSVGTQDAAVWKASRDNRTRYHRQALPTPDRWPVQKGDSIKLAHFLKSLEALCSNLQLLLPVLHINRGESRYRLDSSQGCLVQKQTVHDVYARRKESAKARLISVFESLNRCFTKTSWFLPAYKVDWVEARSALEGLGTGFESACYYLACGTDQGMFTKAVNASVLEDTGALTPRERLEWLERIVVRATNLQQQRTAAV